MEEKDINKEIEQIENKLNVLARDYNINYNFHVNDVFVWKNKDSFSTVRIEVIKRIR